MNFRGNASNPINASQGCYLELYNIITKFDWRGWLAIIPAMMYSFTVQHTIPTLTHPIKEKKYLQWLMMCSFSFVMLCLWELFYLCSSELKCRRCSLLAE